MNRLKQSWILYKASLKLCWQNKRILIFPACSLLAELLLFIIIFSAMLLIHFHGHLARLWHLEENPPKHSIYIWYLLFYYFCFHLVTLLIHGGMLIYVWQKFLNKPISILQSIRLSLSCCLLFVFWFPPFLFFTLALSIFESQTNWLGKLSTKYFGLTWGLSRILFFPVLILEGKSLIDAIRSSSELIQSVWGGRITRRITFSFIYFVLMLPLFLAIYMFFKDPGISHNFLFAGITLFYVVVLSIVHSTLSIIFQLGLYYYIKFHSPPEGYQAEWLDNAFW